MFIKYFRYLLLCVVAVAGFSTRAGSFDDFFSAIRNDNADVVNELLQRGFDPNTRDAKGQPGLMIAMREHSLKVARALLDRPGIEVNALNQAGESALMLAALKGDVAGVQLLLERGAKVNQAGWSALHYAAAGPEPKVVQWLIEHGADINAASPNGTTPLMMAAQYGTEASVDLLLSHGADLKRRNERNFDAVDFARLSGRAWLVKQLEEVQH
jgi:ankyrin repeat protein